MNNKKILIPFLLLLFFWGYFLLYNEGKYSDLPIQTKIESVKIGEKIIKVDSAYSREEHSKGLSGRTNLEESSGMLFVFETSDFYSFWMKDMKFPIDIIWINENFEIVFIEENVLPESFPVTFRPSLASKYVLEVSSGISQKNNFKIGDKVEFYP